MIFKVVHLINTCTQNFLQRPKVEFKSINICHRTSLQNASCLRILTMHSTFQKTASMSDILDKRDVHGHHTPLSLRSMPRGSTRCTANESARGSRETLDSRKRVRVELYTSSHHVTTDEEWGNIYKI